MAIDMTCRTPTQLAEVRFMTRLATALPFLSLLAALLLPAVARAQQDPFSLSAQSTSGPPAQVTVSGSTVVGLVEDVIKSKNQFVPLQGQSVNASLTYGGVNNAIQFQRNAAGTSATLTIPSTGFTRTFTGATSGEVNTQIRDFLIKSGAHEFAQFRRTLSEQSPIAVVDGNPQAATAMLSNSAYYKFGLQRSPLTGGALSSTTPSGAGFRLDVNGGFTDTDFGDGQFVTGELSTAIRLGDRIGISFAFPGMYRTVGDAQVYMAGLEIAVPIVILKPFAGARLGLEGAAPRAPPPGG